MNDDLISRRAAIDALGRIGSLDTYADREYATEIFMSLPSAQQEIIRCKDCLIHGVCRFEQGLGLDGYCSQAERRTDE